MPPTATYRLQLRREFDFHAAAAVVPYLARLGVSHVYCSPVLQATPGSAHGYDVLDHSRLADDLGGDAGWRALTDACRAHGLGVVVDLVPNHMTVPVPESGNAAFWDVLRLGRASQFAEWFDIDWEVEDGRVVLPVLGDPLADCLERGEVTVDADELRVRYFDHEFPLAPGSEKLTDDVAELLGAQHYRLAHWREAATALNYRRFFDVTSLIGVRVEDPEVFAATHTRLLELVGAGDIDGLRIDHPEGLADPAGYLDRLAAASGGRWTLVEKILEAGEELSPAWRCAGTTGYDAIAAVTHVLTDPGGEAPLTRAYADLTGDADDYETVVEASKRQVVEQLFGAEVARLVRAAEPARVQERGAPSSDAIRAAVVELLVAFDVYRTYPGDPASRPALERAVGRARSRRPDLGPALDWWQRVLDSTIDTPAARAVAIRFGQTTGPVMAKGVEDTAFYRYLRLTALNEVGGDPGTFGRSADDWHAFCERIARDWPATMTTLSTHDTKRSEDVRARLLVLAEIPERWIDAVTRWREQATKHGPPDAATDYLIWQTLVGTADGGGLLSAERLVAYLEKATREAKLHTSWLDPDTDYAARLSAYAESVRHDADLVEDIRAFCATYVDGPGESNSLSQKLLQLTMPGVPDVYQGQELGELALVDPDNRRPVDFERRAQLLDALDSGSDVPAKLAVTAAALRLRRDRPATFAGGYARVDADGPAAPHCVAYRRGEDVVAVATRLPVGLAARGGWTGTTLPLPAGNWRDVLTGRPAAATLGTLLDRWPVALLVRADG